MSQQYIGVKLYAYCGGEFGRNSYENKIIEAVSRDWIVAREEHSGNPVFATFGNGAEIEEFIAKHSNQSEER